MPAVFCALAHSGVVRTRPAKETLPVPFALTHHGVATYRPAKATPSNTRGARVRRIVFHVHDTVKLPEIEQRQLNPARGGT